MENVIDYFAIASTGNAVDYGDLTQARGQGGTVNNATRGIHGGGIIATNDNQDTIDFFEIVDFFTGEKFGLDGFKGPKLTFRSWNNQLRQPILLSTHNALIKKTPIQGFLHEKNNLDTLGIDERETKCNF